MFDSGKFWKVFKLLDSDDASDLSTNLVQLAKSERSVTADFFNSVIDQPSHYTTDYRRLRKFLINWYTSHKVVTTVQRQLRDVFSLSNKELDELFKSFGFDYSYLLTFQTRELKKNKADFFLDLINLYKIKGSPESIAKALNYFTLAELDVIEYKLKKYPVIDDIVFWGDVTYSTVTEFDTTIYPDIAYYKIVNSDSHWFKTKEQIKKLIDSRKIGIPSSTPYFSIRPVFRAKELDIIASFLARSVRDQYHNWLTTGTLIRDIESSLYGKPISLLEDYLAAIYCFNINNDVGVSPSRLFLCYDGTSTNYTELLNEYNDIIDPRITSRLDSQNRYKKFLSTFSRSPENDILTDKFSCSEILQEVNPDFLSAVKLRSSPDLYLSTLTTLLVDAGIWLKDRLGVGIENIAYFILGKLALLQELGDVINFFKPLRARFVESSILDIFKNRLMDSSICWDDKNVIPVQNAWDYVTADSHPCCEFPVLVCKDSSNRLYYSRDLYNCGSYFDIGCCWDDNSKSPYEIHVTDVCNDTVCCRKNKDPNEISHNYQIVDSDGETNYASCSGFVNFDEDGVFDCNFANDLAFVKLT